MNLKSKLKTLPLQPGCYLMKDKNNQVIYVGKAKILKNRVNSYFTGIHNNKTTKLVSNIVDFDYIVTPSEKEALILEYNLIKQYKPYFNVIFMDDSSYPYIRLTKEKYPTLKLVRDKKKMKNAIYFGPYPNVTYARDLLELLEKLYPLRKCKNLQEKVCLYYHLGLCLGPCEYEIEEKVYTDITNSIISFINGNTKDIKKDLIKQRDYYSQNLEFEKAQQKQELLQAIENVTASQIMQNNVNKRSCDVFNYYVDKGYISIVGLLYAQGKLLHKHSLMQALYDDPVDVYKSYLVQYYSNNPLPKELIIDNQIDSQDIKEVLSTNIVQPIKGNKRKLLQLAKENAQINLDQKFSILDKESKDNSEALTELKSIIHCDTNRIELYDISHISGSNAICGQVVYIDGKASKKDYRTYKVQNGNNDTENMKEAVYRRLFRSISEETTLPDIIIVDGGVNQIIAIKEILNNLALTNIKLLGLVKNDKHQTANLMNDQLEIIDINKESKLFYLLTNMQDEVHRFSITFHRKLRLKSMNKDILTEIEGIGNVAKNKLVRRFGSLKQIKEAKLEELKEIVNNKQAENIYNYFHYEENNEVNSNE